NPEEGELRPQLLDRFGLSVEVKSPTDIDQRVEVVMRRDAYERDRQTFIAEWAPEDARIRSQIEGARAALPNTATPPATLRSCAEICVAAGSDGLRGELTLLRAARALAAWQGDKHVSARHVRDMAPSALRHRLRKDPLDETGSTARIERVLDSVPG
ncbi:MAG: magnesium chelatase ATPase subunit I, partial [Shimia sp.]